MAIEKEIVDRLLADYRKPEDLTGENGVLRRNRKPGKPATDETFPGIRETFRPFGALN
jgi:hypothetical protein